MKNILQAWNFVRILRLVLGMAILVQGIATRDGVTILLGAALAGLAVMNVGCCGVNGCAVNPTSNAKIEEVQYEEVGANK
jgi:hypothetical protein